MANWPTSVSNDSNLYIAVNSLETTLSSGINNSVSTIPLTSSTGFPTVGAVTIDLEVIFYTGISGNNLTGCIRGSDGTSAASHLSLAFVSAAIVAFHHNALKNEIEAIETDLNNCITSITPVTPGNTATSLANRIAQIVDQIKLGFSLTNWYDTPTPPVFNHNSLSGLQGGTSSQYYHLTSAEHAIATQAASPTLAGYMLTTDQEFAGIKSFDSGSRWYGATSGGIWIIPVSVGTHYSFIQNSSVAADRHYTLPEVGTDAFFVMTEGTQTINGAKTFTTDLNIAYSGSPRLIIKDTGAGNSGIYLLSNNNISGTTLRDLNKTFQLYMSTFGLALSIADTTGAATFSSTVTAVGAVTITPTSNQLILGSSGSTNYYTITAPTPAANRILTIPDPGADASFVMTRGGQNIYDIKDFKDGIQLEGQILADAGTLARPGVSWNADNTSGWYRIGTNAYGFGAGGTLGLEVTNTGCNILGTVTNDNAPAGRVGEYIESVITSVQSFPANGNYGDLTSISLTAGDWDVTATLGAVLSGATMTGFGVGISTTSGNSSTGLVTGSNLLYALAPITLAASSSAVPAYRISISGTTTVYLKFTASYSGGTPKATGRISARRVR